MSNVVLDTGALLAVERNARALSSVLETANKHGSSLRTSAAVVAQAWRGDAQQANVAKLLHSVSVVPIDELQAREIGLLLKESGTSDVVDAHVALLAHNDDRVFTSDPDDIERLLRAAKVRARIVTV